MDTEYTESVSSFPSVLQWFKACRITEDTDGR